MSALATVYSEMAHSALVDEALRLRDERKELLVALEAAAAALNVAFDAEGDTFGVHHNDANDALRVAEVLIAKAKGG